MLLDPGDLQFGFVEETAVSELDLPCRPSCCELQLVLEHLACPVNSGADDAEVLDLALEARGFERPVSDQQKP